MTDNEIIQALEYCAYHDLSCRGCPYAGRFTRKFCDRELHLDALKLIKRQQAENKRLENVVGDNFGRWIPVTERLPEAGERVLVYCKSRSLTMHVTSCTYTAGRYGKSIWSRRVHGVTHWMPLPEPPKGD